ncbi:MAG: hypothetical protein AB1742_03785 [bacterium]
MNSDGEKCEEFIRNIFSFNKEISELIATIDGQFKDEGWISATENTIPMVICKSTLEKHNEWYPSEFFRFYKKSDLKILLFVCIILVERADQAFKYDNLNEPIITAGWFDCSDSDEILKIKGKSNEKMRRLSRIHCCSKNQLINGEIEEITTDNIKGEFKKYPLIFKRAFVFAYPLISIRNAADLKQKISEILIKEINKIGEWVKP